MSVSNPWYFSYPGYNEILTGEVDESINSNDKVFNPNKTILERLNAQPEFKNSTALFGSWDVFPYIVNTQRSKVQVNAGFMPLLYSTLSSFNCSSVFPTEATSGQV